MSRSHPTEQVLATDLQPEEDGSLQAEKHILGIYFQYVGLSLLPLNMKHLI